VIRAIRGEFSQLSTSISQLSSLLSQLFYSKIANILIANILIANILIANILIANILIANILIIFADDEGGLIVDIVKH
jgi:hypothetical protein